MLYWFCLERWLSGRKRLTANEVTPQGVRGFKSNPLRQIILCYNLFMHLFKSKKLLIVLVLLIVLGGFVFFAWQKNWFGLFEKDNNSNNQNNGDSLTSGFNDVKDDDSNDFNDFNDNGDISGDQKNVVYKDTPETGKLRLDIDYPDGNKKIFPVVIFLHGGGWVTGDKASIDSKKWIPEFSKAGFAVASVNYRLAPETTFPGPVEDVKSAIQFIIDNAQKYSLNKDKIAIVGSSAGANLGMLAAFQINKEKPKTVKVIVDLWGPADLTDPNFNEETKGYINQFLGDSAKAAEASPINYVDKDSPAFLIVHGDRDSVVPYEQSLRLQAKLKEVKAPKASLITVLNGVHYFIDNSAQVRPTRAQLQTRINNFLNKYLVE